MEMEFSVIFSPLLSSSDEIIRLAKLSALIVVKEWGNI
jgi:hypothetical protein